MFIEQPLFEARDARHLILRSDNSTSKSQSVLEQAVAHLSQSRSGDINYSVSCPSKKKFGVSTVKSIDQYSVNKQTWLLHSEKIRKLHR